jgi:hypothetical protein
MYRSNIIAPLMTAWLKNKIDDGMIRGPADSQVWDKVLNTEWSHMSVDPRHVWLGLATDGLHPFGHKTTSSVFQCRKEKSKRHEHCGSTDSNFFVFNPKTIPELGKL